MHTRRPITTALAALAAGIGLGTTSVAPAGPDTRNQRGEADPAVAESKGDEAGRADGDDSHDRDRDRDPRRRGWKNPFSELTDDQRERLRKALGEVWSDPEVKAARDAMKSASEVYKSALRDAIGRVDPDLKPVIERILLDRLRHEFGLDDGRSRSFFVSLDEVPEEYHERIREMDKAVGQHEPCRRAFRDIMDSEPGETQMKLFKAWIELAHAYVRESDPELARFLRKPPGHEHDHDRDRDREGGDRDRGDWKKDK